MPLSPVDIQYNFKHLYYQNFIIIIVIIIDIIIIVIITISTLGVFDSSSVDFLAMLEDLKCDQTWRHYVVKKIMAIAVRTSHYVFCRRNKDWDNPELMTFLYFSFFSNSFFPLYFSFIFVQVAKCKLPILRGLQFYFGIHYKKRSVEKELSSPSIAIIAIMITISIIVITTIIPISIIVVINGF